MNEPTPSGADRAAEPGSAASVESSADTGAPRTASGISELLAPGEIVAVETRQHRYLIAREIALGAVGLVVVLAAGGSILAWLSSNGRNGLVAVGLLAVGLVAGLVVGRAGWRILCWRFTWYVVTDRRVILRAGVTTRRSTSAWLERVSEVKLEVPYIARLLPRLGHREYGHLTIQTTTGDGLLGPLRWLPDPTPTAVLVEPRQQAQAQDPTSRLEPP